MSPWRKLFGLEILIILSIFCGSPEADTGFYRMTSILGYRHDGRCGYTYRLRRGAPSRCSVYGQSPCCNYLKEECGSGPEYCGCDDCTDFRTFNLAEKDESIDLSKNEQHYIISELTQHLNLRNWSTIDHIQYSKKINATRRNFVLIVRESLCPKGLPLNLRECVLDDNVIHRLACFLSLDKVTQSLRVANKDCIRAKVYEQRIPRLRAADLQMPVANSSSLVRFILMKLSQMDGGGKWFTSVGGQSITPHKSYKQVVHAELRITPSTCHRSRDFSSGCTESAYGPIKSCAVDVQVEGNGSYRLIHYTCDAMCGSLSRHNDLRSGQWTHWSAGLCHKGILSRIRFCYHPLKSGPAFDCKGTDVKLTEC